MIHKQNFNSTNRRNIFKFSKYFNRFEAVLNLEKQKTNNKNVHTVNLRNKLTFGIKHMKSITKHAFTWDSIRITYNTKIHTNKKLITLILGIPIQPNKTGKCFKNIQTANKTFLYYDIKKTEFNTRREFYLNLKSHIEFCTLFFTVNTIRRKSYRSVEIWGKGSGND